MKIIGSKKEAMSIDDGLARFVLSACPWIHDDWDPERIGWIFILDDNDLKLARSLCIVPHRMKSDPVYSASMNIDLEEFDTWEGEAFHDEATSYWNVVAIVGQEYGFSIFIADSLVEQLPNFKLRAIVGE
jgi:hypothetical protein